MLWKKVLKLFSKSPDSVFGKYFKRGGRDDEYARQPEKFLMSYTQLVWGTEIFSGEGYKFRGRGYIRPQERTTPHKILKVCGHGY